MDEQIVGTDLALGVEQNGSSVVLSIRGELDAYSAPGLEEEVNRLLAGGAKEIVVDMAQTAFLDSSGLRAILTAHRRLDEDGGVLKLRAPSSAVTRLLDITGLTDHFAVISS